MAIPGAEYNGFALTACLNCKRQKKKCDKNLPSCSRCVSGLRTCQYSQDQEKPPSPQYDAVKDCSRPRYVVASSQPSVYISPASSPAGPLPMDTRSFLLPKEVHVHDIHALVTNYVRELLLSEGQTTDHIAAEYFTLTCHWLPFISRMKMHANLSPTIVEQRADVMLLLLAMYLSIQVPGPAVEGTGMRTPLYLRTKELLALVQSGGILSIEVAQATILIAFYEYAHDLSNASYQSISSCAVMACQLGWYDQAANAQRRPLEFEEIKRTWWSIAAFDRLIQVRHINSGFPFAIPNSRLEFELPAEDERWDLFPENPQSPYLISGTAVLQARATQAISHTIEFVKNPPSDPDVKEAQLRELSEALISQAISTVERSFAIFGAHCGAIGMLNWQVNALNVLHTPDLPAELTPLAQYTPSNSRAIFALKKMCNNTTSTVREIFIAIKQLDLRNLIPITLDSIVRSTLIHIELAGSEFGSVDWERDFIDLKGCLAHFGKRFLLARNFLDDVNNAYNGRLQREQSG
ncbi:hypothetical protein BP6252_06447 [Coleophoma cylindrospora]|uniref:Zn(2)-C6 fungal-type domain-containing protein n=1 Tax=Coleophoma cylindrospora TaxID=1849047 RepID=A0A3D8RMM3_9HELO|nr:hypothetical protein BP6252_06447 [Coleophoma cylindrospora]